jgi:glycosyltransferase involved in cell wall biosynthesis
MIATRNRCEELRRTLSKLSQLEPTADEILVCADGCTDGTIEMVRKEFPECRLFENKASKGSIFSRDQMLREARGEIVVSFDDDSYPLDNDFFVQLARSFDEFKKTAVISFVEVRDGETFAHSTKSSSSPAHLVSAYANCGAAMRRDIYLRSHGFPMFFGHMYEEPDYALQCYALGYVVRFEPTLAVRHHVSMNQRDSVRRHHLNARNELWSVFMRCPFPQLIVVATFRVWRQFRYACSEGAAWAIKEPIWWVSALRGIHECVRNRHAVPWPIYYAWMKLARQPNAISQRSANATKALT